MKGTGLAGQFLLGREEVSTDRMDGVVAQSTRWFNTQLVWCAVVPKRAMLT